MNWKIGSRGGRGAVPTRDETNGHRPYMLLYVPIIVKIKVVNMYHFAIRG